MFYDSTNRVYNDCEKSNFIAFDKNSSKLCPLNDSAVKNVFKSELPINQVAPEIFIKNIGLVFKKFWTRST